MKTNFEEQGGAFDTPRFNAKTVYVLMKGSPEQITFDMRVELVLDEIFSAIEEYLEEVVETALVIPEKDMWVEVNFKGEGAPVVKEVIERLKNLGYAVQGIIDDEEELAYMQELKREVYASDDNSLREAYEEAFSNHKEFKVSWGGAFDNG